ncbi:uncharacterized protein JCM15063_003156 [Sporobolomyces koalae]|uniref:uncharacterized protein n=1 Tax=Sporobolomyces koalae TaxID=500713 RepID=UPI003179B979
MCKQRAAKTRRDLRIDLYRYLGAAPASTSFELKRAWHALLLDLHPDRQHASAPETSRSRIDGEQRPGASEINLAWEVLGDPARRAEYDQLRHIHLASQRGTHSTSFAHSVSLDLFTPHYASAQTGERAAESEVDDPDERDEDPIYYTYPCRCSSQYRITIEELEQGVQVIGCEGCSERCQVEYEEVADDSTT